MKRVYCLQSVSRSAIRMMNPPFIHSVAFSPNGLVLSCLVLSCLVLSCLVLSCPVLRCVVCCVVLCCVVLCCVVLCCVALPCGCLVVVLWLSCGCLVVVFLVLPCECLVLFSFVFSCLVLSTLQMCMLAYLIKHVSHPHGTGTSACSKDHLLSAPIPSHPLRKHLFCCCWRRFNSFLFCKTRVTSQARGESPTSTYQHLHIWDGTRFCLGWVGIREGNLSGL